VGGSAWSEHGELLGIVAILLSAVSWSVGVHFSRRVALPDDPLAASAITLLCGAALLWIASGITGEFARVNLEAVSTRSTLGLAYLITFGTIVAFTSYTWLLSHVSATVVSTHTYVNPIVAVLLGWLLAGEPLSLHVLVAGGVILGSVVLIRRGTQKAEVAKELAACEQ